VTRQGENVVDRTKLTEAYARLHILKQDLANYGEIEQTYINMYHAALYDLQTASGYDLSRYKIPDTEIHQQVTGWEQRHTRRTRFENVPTYSDKYVCDATYFLVQVNTVLLLFQLEIQHPEQRPIGFRPPQ